MARLSDATLAAVPPAVVCPGYERGAVQPGIVHLGIGAFMRAHLAVATEAALQGGGDLRFGIVGVSLRQPAMRDALAPQDGLYSVATCDADVDGRARRRLQVIGCVQRVHVAPEEPEAVLDAIAAPATRIVSLTITEKGYADATSGALAFLADGLERRRRAGRGPLTLLSLDNLPSNGDTLRRLLLAAAEGRSQDLARWIADGCTFPNSMVDRIVPRTTTSDLTAAMTALGLDDAGAVACEPFFDWVLEDHFAAGRPAWEHGGVRFVDAVAPYETLKLRCVNGSHSTIAYLGAMAGWATVDAAVARPALRRAVEALLHDEVEPTLPPLPGLDLAAYRARLLQRFANPALVHRTQQIAMDGTQKLPQRLVAPLRARLAAGLPVPRLALAVAAWGHYLRGRDESGRPYAIDDPQASALAELAARIEAAADARTRAAVLVGFAPVFGDLAGAPPLIDAVAAALPSLRDRGVLATLESLERL